MPVEHSPSQQLPSDAPVVEALRRLCVFSAAQSAAYREHFAELSQVMGPDVETRLGNFLREWSHSGQPGAVVLTGNAGTGKTAAAEAYCRALGTRLPAKDELLEVAPDRWVLKDLSGIASPASRADVLSRALQLAGRGQVLVCANEGILRDAFGELSDGRLDAVLDEALRNGAAADGGRCVVNVNRQRPTGPELWGQLLDYVTREELWEGCDGCPIREGGCPMRSNAERLRRPDVRGQLRTLLRIGAGDAVPTLREVLAILAWAIVGDDTCKQVKGQFRDLGRSAATASDSYFSRVLGGGLTPDAAERSPLMSGLKASGLGSVSDLQVDGWLRDCNDAPGSVREIAGYPPHDDPGTKGLHGSRSPLDRVKTAQQPMTFHALGEMISTDEDTSRVEDGLRALVGGDSRNPSAQALWRRRVYFEASAELGGAVRSGQRLLRFRHATALAELAAAVAAGADTVLQLKELVRGLNFLVTGFPSSDEGMIVPEPACLFSRDPGAFRPAAPSLVHSLVPMGHLSLRVPDSGMVERILDIDHVDVLLVVDGSGDLALRIGARMYEAIREAADFEGPVGQGVAEMNDLRGFYGRLAEHRAGDGSLRAADPRARPPALLKITLPHFGER